MYNEDVNANKGATAISYGGISFSSILQIVFITLKLCGVIDWNWGLVMLPLILSVGLPLVVIGGFLMVLGITSLFDRHNK